MTKFRYLSIKKKLLAISMLTSGVALFFASLAFIGSESLASWTSARKNISSLARVIGKNCVAALTFDDQDAANDTLRALSAEPQIVFARIYRVDKSVFAEYRRKGNMVNASESESKSILEESTFGSWSDDNYFFHRGELHVFEPIVLDQRNIGMVEVSTDLGELYKRLQSVVLICAIILVLSFLVGCAISIRIQRTISEPIMALTHTMDNVSKNKDYSIRVEKKSQDELGMLFDGFNEMLAEIQARDEKLHFTQFSVDHMGDAAFWIASDGSILYVNNAACTTLGYSRDELLSMKIFDLSPNLTKSRSMKHWKSIRLRKSFAFESTYMRKDGTIFPVEVSSNYLEYQGREYVFDFARDITERRRLQTQLEQAQKMEAIGTLAGGVAHDLNNILGGLVSYPDLLLMELPDDSPYKNPLLAVKKSGEKAAAVVQDMLTLARRGVGPTSAVNLNEIVTDYLKTPEHNKILQSNPGIDFEICLEEGLPNILGSALHLSKALMNLVSNAAEAMPDGGAAIITTFSLSFENPLHRYETIKEGHYAVLRVEDKGCGISKTDMARIFDPFYTKKVMGRSGTGLGMTVVSGTVKDHKGFIDTKSIEGRGARFDLYFPITNEVPQKKKIPDSVETSAGTERILVIDDIEEQRNIASLLLGRLDYQVDTVSSGEEAVEFLRKEQVDLLILDMIMEPGMDGLETYKKILDFRPGQKAVIASGYAETDRVKEAMRLGVGAYVKKPYTIEKLGKAVRDELDRQL